MSSMSVIYLLLLFVAVFVVANILLERIFGNNTLKQRLADIEKEMQDQVSSGDVTPKPFSRRDRPTRFKFLRVPDSVRKAILESGIDLQVEEFVMLWMFVTCGPSALVYFLSQNFLMAISLAAILAILPPFYVSMERKKQTEAFESQLGDVLMLISNSLRSGFSFEQAFESAGKDSSDPLKREFTRASREMKMGVSMETALYGISERSGSTNMKLVTSAVLVQRQVGGNLADILDGISNTIRERIAIRKNIKTLTAQGRVSGLIIGALPIFLFFVITFINPSYMSVFTTTLFGRILLAICIIFEVVGALVIRKLINIDM